MKMEPEGLKKNTFACLERLSDYVTETIPGIKIPEFPHQREKLKVKLAKSVHSHFQCPQRFGSRPISFLNTQPASKI